MKGAPTPPYSASFSPFFPFTPCLLSHPALSRRVSVYPFFSHIPHKPLLPKQRWWLNGEEEAREEKNRERTMVHVWRWLYSSHNTLHLRSCKRSVLQLLLAASSAQQDKATVILHSPHPSSIISTLVTLFSSYSPPPPRPRTPLFFPHLTFFSTYFILYMMELTVVARSTSQFWKVSKISFLFLSIFRSWKDPH